MRFDEINGDGEVILHFDQAYRMPTMKQLNKFRQTGHFRAQIIPTDSENRELLKFNWNITEIDEATNQVNLKLNFTNPEVISQGTAPDTLKITIKDAFKIFVLKADLEKDE